MELDADRPQPTRRRRQSDSDADDEPPRRCDWCGEPYARELSLDSVRRASAWLAVQLTAYSLGHYSCAYSACCALLPHARDDLCNLVRSLLEAESGGIDIVLVPSARRSAPRPRARQ